QGRRRHAARPACRFRPGPFVVRVTTTSKGRHEMQYLLLIHDDPQPWADMSDDERNLYFGGHMGYSQSLVDAGRWVGGNQPEGTDSATVGRVRDGETPATDGPFAETKEQLAGYYLIEAESLDEALEWAARIPSSRIGTIEVRPVVPSRVTAEAAG